MSDYSLFGILLRFPEFIFHVYEGILGSGFYSFGISSNADVIVSCIINDFACFLIGFVLIVQFDPGQIAHLSRSLSIERLPVDRCHAIRSHEGRGCHILEVGFADGFIKKSWLGSVLHDVEWNTFSPITDDKISSLSRSRLLHRLKGLVHTLFDATFRTWLPTLILAIIHRNKCTTLLVSDKCSSSLSVLRDESLFLEELRIASSNSSDFVVWIKLREVYAWVVCHEFRNFQTTARSVICVDILDGRGDLLLRIFRLVVQELLGLVFLFFN